MQWNYWKNKSYSNGKNFNETCSNRKHVPTEGISTKTIPTKSTSPNVYILLAFLLITLALLIAISIYVIKHRLTQKYLLP